MFIEVVKSKIHKVTVTEANLQYVGSVTIDAALMEAANIIENEKVQIVNVNNGERIETYVIKGERNSGIVCLNGRQPENVQSEHRYHYFLCFYGFRRSKTTQTYSCISRYNH